MAQAVINRQEELERLWELALSLVDEDKEVSNALSARSEPENPDARVRIQEVWIRAKDQMLAQSASHISRVEEHRKLQQEALDFWTVKKQELGDQESRGNPQITREVCDQYMNEYGAKVAQASQILNAARQIREVLVSLPDYPF